MLLGSSRRAAVIVLIEELVRKFGGSGLQQKSQLPAATGAGHRADRTVQATKRRALTLTRR